MSTLYPPLNFGAVEDGVYRSAFPTEINFHFLQSLNLKSVILLESIKDDDGRFGNFLEDFSIRVFHVDNSVSDSVRGFSPVAEEMVVAALQTLIDRANQPVLVTCASGKFLTGTVIGCLRKMQRWSLVSIFEEYRRFAGPRVQQQHEQFIELFDTDLVVSS